MFVCQEDLESDPLLKDRLISLSRVDGHARWVSPAVLRHMKDLPEKVDGGLIVRDEQGNPTGLSTFLRCASPSLVCILTLTIFRYFR